ncbi:MAG: hypothetical protein ACXAC2_16635 [Candidatus Kariarchaeaceae archaeon]|jgi:hypothetical protein
MIYLIALYVITSILTLLYATYVSFLALAYAMSESEERENLTPFQAYALVFISIYTVPIWVPAKIVMKVYEELNSTQ